MNSIVSEKTYIANRLGVPYENLSQSYLRSETELNTQSVIDFVLQKNKKNSPLVTERLLDLNDEFVITHFTVGLKITGTPSPTALEQLNAIVETYEIQSIPNSAAIYNSDLSFTIDRKEFVPQFPVRAFRRVPTTQTEGASINGYDNGLYAFYPSEPTKINGRQTLDLSINIQDSVSFDPGMFKAYAVFEARGYLVVNSLS